MSIAIVCNECGTKLTAADSLAGKSAKCKKCGAKIHIPPPVPANVGGAEFLDSWLSDPAEEKQPEESAAPQRAECPFCRELIIAGAIKCRYCGESLRASGVDGSAMPKLTSDKTETKRQIAATLSLIAPGLGQLYNGEIIWGVILLASIMFSNSIWLGMLAAPATTQSDDDRILFIASIVASIGIAIFAAVNAYSTKRK